MKSVWRVLRGVWLLLRGMGTLSYSIVRYPFKASLIDRNTGKVIGHFNAKELAEFRKKHACPTCGQLSKKIVEV